MESKDRNNQSELEEDLLDLDEFPDEDQLPQLKAETAPQAAEKKPAPAQGETTRMVGLLYRKQPGKPAQVKVMEAPAEPESLEAAEQPPKKQPPKKQPEKQPPEPEPKPAQTKQKQVKPAPRRVASPTNEKPAAPQRHTQQPKKQPTVAEKPPVEEPEETLEQVLEDAPETLNLEPEEPISAPQPPIDPPTARRRERKPVPPPQEEDSIHLVEDWGEEEPETGGFPWPWKRERDTEPEPEPELPLADLPVRHLTTIYGNGIVQAKRRLIGAFLVCLVLIYMNLADSCNLPLPVFLWDDRMLAALGLELLGVILLLLLNPFCVGLKDWMDGKTGMHTVISISVLLTILDSIAFLAVLREGPLPCVAVSGLALCSSALGQYAKQRGQWLSCRAAAASSNPGRLVRQREEGQTTKLLLRLKGRSDGFGSQIQAADGVERMTHTVSGLVLVAAAVLSLLSALGSSRYDLLLWNGSVIFAMAAPLSATLAYGLPYRKIARRLNRSGAALAGWDGVCALNASSEVAVVDNDLFPTGMVSCNGLKTYGNVSEQVAVGYAATLVRRANCGLEQTFANLVYTQGARYWTEELSEFVAYEGGGYGGHIRKDEVLVGTSDFMELMGVQLPQGISVKTAAFCAINGRLAAQFALIYQMPGYVEPSLKALLRAKLSLVMAVRDFNLSAKLLDTSYALPVEKLFFPDMDTRMSLDQDQKDAPLGALLGREGMDAHCDSVLGAKRLYRVARRNGGWSIAAALVGLLLGFYLTYTQAFLALQPENILAFLVLWSIPALLNTYPVDRF